MPDFPSLNRLHLGAAYYPEHWPEERWPADIALMQAAGFSVARLGEFAWSSLEPAEGQFCFDWLERAITRLAEAGIATVLGTPTAAPPAWLVARYPQALAVDERGQPVQFGNRCHYCVNSPDFHAAVRRTLLALAERFGPNPHVIGWQIDNEYNRVCYCPRCRQAFQQFLEVRFGSLEELNRRWTTAYWSQTYSTWQQIPLPVGEHNPGLRLAFKRFVSDSYRRFQRLQLEVLRPQLKSGDWVTHNFMGWNDTLDYASLAADLDLASWDWYIGTGHHDYLKSGASHDLMRGFRRQNFWVMETQPGSVNWAPLNTSLAQGEGRAMAWHAVAHGADGLLYWQWRSALGGQEQYHGSLVDQAGKPRPFYAEVQQIGREFAALSPLIAGSTPKARVALLYDYDSRWSLGWQRHHQDFDYLAHFYHYYRPLALLNVPMDVIYAGGLKVAAQLVGYKVIFAPALNLLNDSLVQALLDFVNRGGHLVLTARSAMKDAENALLPARQPGPFAEPAGIEVEEYYALQEPVPIKGNWFEGHSQIWAERLLVQPTRNPAQIIARYGKSNGWLDDQPAITVKAYKNGLIYYVGAYLDEAAQRAMLTRFMRTAGITMIGTDLGLEVSTRLRPDNTVLHFLINHTPDKHTLWLPWPAHEHLSGIDTESEIKLGPYGVAIVTQIKEPPAPAAVS
jgi:beta-galactosidase